MVLKRKIEDRWDPVAGLLRVGLSATNVLLILVSLSIVIWQGYTVISNYISQPISTEQKLLSLDDIPNIHMSICKKFEITDCKLPMIDTKEGPNCNKQQLPAYFINQSDQYDIINDDTIPIHFRDMMDYIWIWNESQTMWTLLFDSSSITIEDENSLFTQQMYPYNGKNTLLCYTLKEDIRTLAPMLKFQKTGTEGSENKQICTQKHSQ